MGRKSDLSEYTPQMQLPSQTARIAHFLDWAAQHCPHDMIPYNKILQAVEGTASTPQMKSPRVTNLRNAMSSVRKHLLRVYSRGVHTTPGTGCRATVDDADMVNTDVTTKSIRVQSAVTSLAQVVAVVDTTSESFKTLPSEKQAWMKKDVKGLISHIKSDDYLKRLLPPGSKKLLDLEAKEKKTT